MHSTFSLRVTVVAVAAAILFILILSVPAEAATGPSCTTQVFSGKGDGRVENDDNAALPWKTVRDDLGFGKRIMATTTETEGIVGTGWKGDNTGYTVSRAYIPFDTSKIPSRATITKANLNLFINGDERFSPSRDKLQLGVVQSFAFSTSTLTAFDYGTFGASLISNGYLQGSTLNLGAYNAVTLNTFGLAAVNRMGWTKVGIRSKEDIENIDPKTLYNAQMPATRFGAFEMTNHAPYLEVNYTMPVGMKCN